MDPIKQRMAGLRPKSGVAYAMREAIAEGYNRRDFRSDLMAGLSVGVVGLPLSMALGIAVGVRPENGLYTAIVAGALIAIFGGSRVQVSGPTAAFVVILAPIVHAHGISGLMVATLMAGVILLGLGLARMGRAISLVPYPVVTGFTAGIGIVIALLQLKDFLGLTVTGMPEGTIGKTVMLLEGLGTTHWPDFAIGVGTLVTLFLWSRWIQRVPAALVAILMATVVAWLAHLIWPSFELATVMSKFATPEAPSGIPRALPALAMPWGTEINLALVEALLPAAVAIALLGAIESLLSAVVADGMTEHRHDPDGELVGQGIGNIVAPFFGGIAATGAIARTAINVRSGARSPIAAVVQCAFLVAALLVLAPMLGQVPMAAMAALLLFVAWNMADLGHVVRMVRSSPGSDVVVLLTCLGLTVATNMVWAVLIGVALAGLLFIRRMMEVSTVQLISDREGHAARTIPGVRIYDVGGPMFFGAAQRAMRALEQVDDQTRAVVLDLVDVPAMDATALVNLESAAATLMKRGVPMFIGGLQEQPGVAIRRSCTEWNVKPQVFATIEEAVLAAEQVVRARAPTQH